MEWKDIKGYEGHYQISDNGDIFSLKSNRVLKTMKNKKNGYIYIHLTKDGKKKAFTIHRLVALHFCGGYEESLVVDHIDRNRHNNHFSNLRWVSRKENSSNISADTKKNIITAVRKNAKSQSQRSNRKIRPVISISPEGVIRHHRSITQASKETGVTNASISNNLNKGSRLMSGYRFLYKDRQLNG
ncbi:HNH homing nuclease [Bacillus phage CampHawk]|uniref:HNH homing nuclease n=2 Tax=Okubovirus TaxID=1857845 RepID=U5PX57_9CAUD|nr:HNH endonuclease [Bacillus phage CampHawk]AAA56884.1 endodeoxyribonuclease [Bacillus phage SP82]AGY47023.1 HNH homing nuclease [Bacillus phage CampHawk]UNY49098.1 HNH homing endonuclease [Bacillus phage SP82G]WIT26477.1 hypothetical protein [Bacillus phage SPO1L4]